MRVFSQIGIACILFAGGGLTLARASSLSPLICSNPGSTTASPSDSTIAANSCTDFSFQYPTTQPSTGLNNWQYGYYPGAYTSGSTPPTFTLFTQQVQNPDGSFEGTWALNFDQYFTSEDAFGSHSNGIFTDYHIAPFCNQSLYQNCSTDGGPDPRSPNSPDSATQEAVRRYIVPGGVGSTLVDITLQVQKDPRVANPTSQPITEYVVLYDGGTATLLGAITDPVNLNPNIQGAPPTSQGIPQPVYSINLDNVAVKSGDFIDFVTAPNFINGQSYDYSSGTFELATINSVSTPQTTPEPASLVLAGAGLVLFGVLRKDRFGRRR